MVVPCQFSVIFALLDSSSKRRCLGNPTNRQLIYRLGHSREPAKSRPTARG
jgi:hypothetical protein